MYTGNPREEAEVNEGSGEDGAPAKSLPWSVRKPHPLKGTKGVPPRHFPPRAGRPAWQYTLQCKGLCVNLSAYDELLFRRPLEPGFPFTVERPNSE
jgi:hypothetical protein